MHKTQKEPKKIYNFDGDNIGRVVDDYVLRNDIEALSIFSAKVASATEEIRKIIIQNGGTVILCAGDNIMFQGNFENLWCEKLLSLFLSLTGCTASLGVGNTGAESYLALSLAKANGGGKTIRYPW